MATSDDVAAQLLQTAADGIAESEGDGQRVKAQPLKDLIEADRYLASKAGSAQPWRGLRFTKLVPPGAV